jgi:hypothetical protein
MTKTCARTCPLCGHLAKVIRSESSASGTRRRRVACQNHSCGHRWSEWDGPRPPRNAAALLSRAAAARGGAIGGGCRWLSEAEIRRALLCRDVSHRAMAQELGCSRETVRQLRLGLTNADVAPELPRWEQRPRRTCEDCKLWSGSCSIGLPDPEEEGTGFAVDCACFAPVSEASAGSPLSAGAG